MSLCLEINFQELVKVLDLDQQLKFEYIAMVGVRKIFNGLDHNLVAHNFLKIKEKMVRQKIM